MKVKIKNHLLTLTGSSSVYDETNQEIYRIKGRLISPTHVKWVCDQKGNRLYKVRNKFWHWFSHSAYVYDAHGTKLAKVKHPFFSIKKFIVQGFKNEIMIDGDFFSFKSTIMKDGQPAGVITRNLTLVTDVFDLEADEKEMPFMIALVIAIDNICDNMRKSN